jgi:hypothetical protein
MVMKRAASNGRGQNVSAITALHVVNPFSEVHKPAEHAKSPSLMTLMVLCEGKPKIVVVRIWLTHIVKPRDDIFLLHFSFPKNLRKVYITTRISQLTTLIVRARLREK